MSSRQPVKANSIKAPVERANLFFNFGHLFWIQLLQELPGLDEIEFRIVGFDTKKETVYGRVCRERRHVENGMIRHGQLIHRKHSEHGAEGCQQHGALKGDRNKRRPANERPATDVMRISN